jgi:hypothetical protein
MEVFLPKVLNVLAWLFLPMWLTIFVGGILLGIGESRGLVSRDRAHAIGLRVAIIFFCYYIAIVGSSLLLDHVRANAWRKMLAQHPSRLILTAPIGGNSVEIDDPNAINQLLTIVVKTKHVWAHHSHDIPEVTLNFPEFDRKGSLGRDSQNEHEFWGPLGQFRSEELDQWLQTNWRSYR